MEDKDSQDKWKIKTKSTLARMHATLLLYLYGYLKLALLFKINEEQPPPPKNPQYNCPHPCSSVF